MHVYSSDNEFRSTFLAILGVIAFVIVFVLNVYVFPWLYQQIPFEMPPLLVPSLAFGVVFGLIHRVFNRRLWNKPWMPDFIVAVPDLTGHWEGKIRSSYEGEIPDDYLADGGHQLMPATLDIEQTWSKITVHFETRRSPSVSTGASFQIEGRLHTKLSYLCENEGADVDEQAENEGPYDGTTRLTYRESKDRLTGYYYTGPSRASRQNGSQKTTYGTMKFTRDGDETQR